MNTNANFRKGYHDLLRPEILSLVPSTAKRILDLGCGTGALGEALKSRQQCVVNGVENNPEAAAAAKTKLDNIYEDDLNLPRNIKYGEKYNCIIFADILEHLFDPWSTLRRECRLLKDDGLVIASIPNIEHPGILHDLNQGLWRYSPAGILDITHLRFFTKTSITQMFLAAGLKIKTLTAFPGPENPQQIIVTAIKKKKISPAPLVTLIMLTLNAWDYTNQALISIFKNTITPFELIVVDNGSVDQTRKHLRENNNISLIENSHNLGFATGINQALGFVHTPYFAILNNDIVVTKDWLANMIEVLNSDDNIAIVGPRTNYASGPQVDNNARYSTEEELATFAEAYKKNRVFPPRTTNRIVFFCTLLRSKLLKEIGGLDERYGLGNFEDDDYCASAVKKGYLCAIDDGTYIHHWGSQTFRHSNIDHKKLMLENQKKFNAKWNRR